MAKNNNKGGNKENSNDGVFGGPPGYKNPPKSGQFKPGQSGNPKGRPKKERDPICDIIEDVFFAEQMVNIGGNPKKMRAIKIVLMKLVQRAQQGNERATSLMFSLMEKHGFTETKLQIIPPFVPSRGELAKYFEDELEDDYEYSK